MECRQKLKKFLLMLNRKNSNMLAQTYNPVSNNSKFKTQVLTLTRLFAESPHNTERKLTNVQRYEAYFNTKSTGRQLLNRQTVYTTKRNYLNKRIYQQKTRHVKICSLTSYKMSGKKTSVYKPTTELQAIPPTYLLASCEHALRVH